MHRSPRILLTSILLLALTPAPGHGAVGWTPLGPGGAPIHALAVDPTSPTTVYAAFPRHGGGRIGGDYGRKAWRMGDGPRRRSDTSTAVTFSAGYVALS